MSQWEGVQEGGAGRTLETEIEQQGVWDKEKKKEWKQDEN